ncbi:MAG: hypothetical protein LBB91_09180 [Clostridiales bacterium]|jgi:DNA polymerase/3'-5' exonuclease PolX|nr:hypothetical protein [Clostridiales bacterium]
MTARTVRYTATLPHKYIDELKKLAKEKIIPSVNFAINEALDEYLKSRKMAQYEALMKEAGQDNAFLSRTLSCAKDFKAIDSEVPGTW